MATSYSENYCYSSTYSKIQHHKLVLNASFILNQAELDREAKRRGWDIRDVGSFGPMASYSKDGIRLDFWLPNGNMASYLDDRNNGKTQFFQRKIGMSQASEIFKNPCQHPTGVGHHANDEANELPFDLPTTTTTQEHAFEFEHDTNDEAMTVPEDWTTTTTTQEHEVVANKDFVLNQSELDDMAKSRGWDILDATSSNAPMASYSKDEVRLNFWLTTGTVGSYLDHPTQGKTQLFRRDIDMSQAPEIFDNPRVHTGVGYHKKDQAKNVPVKRNQQWKHHRPRFCRSCKRNITRADFSKNQLSKGKKLAKCKMCVDYSKHRLPHEK